MSIQSNMTCTDLTEDRLRAAIHAMQCAAELDPDDVYVLVPPPVMYVSNNVYDNLVVASWYWGWVPRFGRRIPIKFKVKTMSGLRRLYAKYGDAS